MLLPSRWIWPRTVRGFGCRWQRARGRTQPTYTRAVRAVVCEPRSRCGGDGGLRLGPLLGALAWREGHRSEAAAGTLRASVREAQQDRCGRLCSAARGGTCRGHHAGAGEKRRAASPARAASHPLRLDGRPHCAHQYAARALPRIRAGGAAGGTNRTGTYGALARRRALANPCASARHHEAPP